MKEKQVPVKFKEEQYNKIKETADTLGLGIAPYIRMVVLERISLNETMEAQKTIAKAVKDGAFRE